MYAKLSTAKTVSFGPVLDTDGAEYTGAAVGDVKICVNNGTPAALDGSATLTHKEVGLYELVLTANDISAVGQATVVLSKTTYIAPPVVLDILPAKVYDSLVGGTDNLEVDAVKWAGGDVALGSNSSLPMVDIGNFNDEATPTTLGNLIVVFNTDFATNYNTTADKWQVQSDLISIGGVAQSATDLKDFADTGYNPSTHKVAGVVLADTVTTYTGNTPQTGDSFARIGATGSGLTSLAQASLVTAARMAALTDWIEGGRLDLLIDAIKAKTDLGLINTTWTDAKAGYIDEAISAAKTLTSGERTTLAAAIEAAIINELDGTAVMQAIADLIASDMTTGDLTVLAIASAVRDAVLNRVLAGNHDTAGTTGKVLQDIIEDTGTTLPTAIADVPTVAEFEARTIPAANYFDPAADPVANVTTTGSVTNPVTTDAASQTASKADVSLLAREASLSDGTVKLHADYDAAKTAAQANDAMTLTAAERNAIADAYHARPIQANPTAKEYTQRFAILMMMNSNLVDNAGFITVYDTADAEVAQLPVTTDAAADPITGVS